MITKKKSFIFMVLLLFLFTSCKLPFEFKYLWEIYENQVPFAVADPRWNEWRLVEVDDYGRELYYYETVDQFHPRVFADFNDQDDGHVRFYLICQKHDEKNSWFYNTECFLIVPKELQREDEKLLSLLEKNDWNEALQENKMGVLSLPKKDTYEISGEESTLIVDSLKSILALSEDVSIYLDRLQTENGSYYYVMRGATYEEDNVLFCCSYLFRIAEDGEIIDLVELTGSPDSWNKQLRDYQKSFES